MQVTKTTNILLWLCSLVAAGIMLQTLFFKFSAAEESIYIFSELGIEPWGRIGSGVVELIASLLLVFPFTRWMGALLGFGTMIGAVCSHLFILGIEIMNDGGLLFLYALIVLFCCTFIIWANKHMLLNKKT